MRLDRVLTAALFVALTTQASAAGPKPAAANAAAAEKAKDPAAEAFGRLALSIQRRTLSNGLRVVLSPDGAAPTVAVAVTYDVG